MSLQTETYMESVQSQVALPFAKQAKYHSVNIDLKLRCVTQKKRSELFQGHTERFQQLWAGGCFAEISRIRKTKAKAKLCPGFVPQFDIPLSSSLSPAGMRADSRQGKNSLVTLEIEKKGLT